MSLNPKYARFLKQSERSTPKRDLEDDLFGEESKPTEKPPAKSRGATPAALAAAAAAEAATRPPQREPDQDPRSLYEIFKDIGDKKWLDQNHTPARLNFNLFHASQYPELGKAGKAEGLSVCVVKGTSFADKSEACLEETRLLEGGQSTGEIELVPEPENPYDANALKVVSKTTGKHLGFVPKASDVNLHYTKAMAEGRLTGAYLIEARRSKHQGKASVMLFLATGWKNPPETETKAETSSEPF